MVHRSPLAISGFPSIVEVIFSPCFPSSEADSSCPEVPLCCHSTPSIFIPEIRAILRCIVRLHCHNCLIPDFSVVVQPLSELIPASIRNGFSQVVILDHIRNLQILIDDDIVRCHYASGLLYCPIFTLSLDF